MTDVTAIRTEPEDVVEREARLMAAAERRERREERLRATGFEDVTDDARRGNLALHAATKPWPQEESLLVAR